MSDFQRPACQNRSACAAKSPVTHCRRCSIMRVAASPELEAKRCAGIKNRFTDPAYLAEHTDRLRAAVARASLDPAYIERRREHGRRQVANHLTRPEVLAKAQAPEVRKAAGQKGSATRLAWCPPELRDQYRAMVRAKGIPAAEARRIIEAEIPGTVEHGRREHACTVLKLQLNHERQKREAY